MDKEIAIQYSISFKLKLISFERDLEIAIFITSNSHAVDFDLFRT
jgi:hypothetical protein